MGVAAGPKTVTDGLVFSLDARNVKTYDEIPGITDHGISDWYCFISGTATYSAIYPNTEIIEIDADGNETVLVTTGSDPQRGDITTTVGRRYYGTKAVHLLQTTANDNQHELAPVSFAGTYFAHYWIRNSPTTYYAYAPQDDTTLEFFDNNTAGGVTGTVTSTYNISKGSSTSFQSTSINTWQFFKSNKPIIMTAGGTGWDKTILAPATQYNYKRRDSINNITINNTAPSTSSTYVTYDTSLPVVTVEIADGAGGDCTQGIGYEYLSDTYSWGNLLSDFSLVSPYADNVVNVSYWENNQWNLGGSYSLNGTQTSPAVVYRTGPTGFDTPPTSGYSGNYANFNTSYLWKFEGTYPFALVINDTADDEENMLGWMSNKYLRTSSNVTQSFVNLIDKEDRSRMKIYGKDLTTTIEYAGAKLSASDYFEFDGVDDIIKVPHQDWQNSNDITIFTWVYPTIFDVSRNILGKSGNSGYRIRINANGNFFSILDRGTTNSLTTSYSFSLNTWYNIVAILGSTGLALYINGEFLNSNSTPFGGNITTQPLAIGAASYTNAYDEDFIGRIASVNFYTEILTAAEVQQNYNATKSRFGL